MLLIWNVAHASGDASELTTPTSETVDTPATQNETIEPKFISIDAQTRLQIIDLYDCLRTIEDDLDRVNALDRSDEDIAQIEKILETKKIDILRRLSCYRGFDYLANVSHKQRFTSKTDYTVLEVACYTLLGISLTALTLSSVNIAQIFKGNTNVIGIPSQQCLEENLEGFVKIIQKVTHLLV